MTPRTFDLCPACRTPVISYGHTCPPVDPADPADSDWRDEDLARAQVLVWCLIAFLFFVVAVAASAVCIAIGVTT